MLAVLKIIHFLCLFGGGAAMMGNGILARRLAVADAPPSPMVTDAMKRLGMIGLMSIVLLWLTGAGMVVMRGGVPDLLFYVKLLGAAAVLWGSVMAGRTAAQAESAGVPPDFAALRLYGMATALGSALAVVLAVVVFG